MKETTRELIHLYYSNDISSQRLIAHIKKHETETTQVIYMSYHKMSNCLCEICNNFMKYSGFKHGFRCTNECGYAKRSLDAIENKRKRLQKFSLLHSKDKKKTILENITKQNFVSKKFLRLNNISEKECFNIVYGYEYCKYCEKEAIFKNWASGYLECCKDILCSKKQRKERVISTNMRLYGVKNVGQIPAVIHKKQQTLKRNYGVSNIGQLKSVQYKIRQTQERLGNWGKQEDKSDWELYSSKVRRYSEHQNIKSLENSELRGSFETNGYHLDHISSVFDGFHNNVPVHIIGNINNLRFIPARENLSKHKRSDMSLDKLILLMS